MGYHTKEIKKGILGEFSKINEEFEELKDAVEQNSNVLIICELTDLIGAIEEYSKKFNLTLSDLITFSNQTKSAFSEGKRIDNSVKPKEYLLHLLHLLGKLTEIKSEKYPKSRFWKNDKYGVVLELEKSGNLWVHYEIWYSFSNFFSLQYNETQPIMKDVLEEHLKLGEITPNGQFATIMCCWKNI